jgi:hypothetical protein
VCGARWGKAELGDVGPISDEITYSAYVSVGVDACVCSESCSDLRYSDTQGDCEVAVTRRVGRLGRTSTLALPLPMAHWVISPSFVDADLRCP